MCAEVAQRSWLLSDERENRVEQRCVGDESPIAAQKSKIAEQRTTPEFAFRHHQKAPAVLIGEALRDREFSLDFRLWQLVGGFDFDESRGAFATLNQKVRHDVGASPRSTQPRRAVMRQQLNHWT